jgi:hypothetical protein
MSLETIIDHIKTVLEGVSGMAIVHDFSRYATTSSAVQTLYVSDGVFNAWEIDRAATPATKQTNVHTRRRHQLKLYGYLAVNDAAASGTTFRALVEAVEAALRDDDTLGGTALVAGPVSVDLEGHIMKAGVLCHYAELSLPAVELVT